MIKIITTRAISTCRHTKSVRPCQSCRMPSFLSAGVDDGLHSSSKFTSSLCGLDFASFKIRYSFGICRIVFYPSPHADSLIARPSKLSWFTFSSIFARFVLFYTPLRPLVAPPPSHSHCTTHRLRRASLKSPNISISTLVLRPFSL